MLIAAADDPRQYPQAVKFAAILYSNPALEPGKTTDHNGNEEI